MRATLRERLARAVRKADLEFENGNSGGGTRHWIRECFLPCLHEEGLEVCDIATVSALEARVLELEGKP